MHNLFNIDGPLASGLNRFIDCILLSLCWIVASLPIITIGASCGALYRTAYRCIRKDDGHPLKTFWTVFRQNIKTGILTWVSVCAVYILLLADIIIIRNLMPQWDSLAYLSGVLAILIVLATVWAAYCTAYCVRFEGRLKDVLRLSLILTLSHPLMSIAILVLLIIGVVLILILPFSVLLLPTLLSIAISFPMEKVFLVHMRPEDVEALRNEP